MGAYSITIQGIGPHHNCGRETDADRLASELVARLKASGHSVYSALFYVGMAEDLISWEKPKDDERDHKSKVTP